MIYFFENVCFACTREALLSSTHIIFQPLAADLSGPVAMAVAVGMTVSVAVKVWILCERGRFFGEKESVSRRRNAIFEKIHSLLKLHTQKKQVCHPHGTPFFLADRNFHGLVTQQQFHKC